MPRIRVLALEHVDRIELLLAPESDYCLARFASLDVATNTGAPVIGLPGRRSRAVEDAMPVAELHSGDVREVGAEVRRADAVVMPRHLR